MRPGISGSGGASWLGRAIEVAVVPDAPHRLPALVPDAVEEPGEEEASSRGQSVCLCLCSRASTPRPLRRVYLRRLEVVGLVHRPPVAHVRHVLRLEPLEETQVHPVKDLDFKISPK